MSDTIPQKCSATNFLDVMRDVGRFTQQEDRKYVSTNVSTLYTAVSSTMTYDRRSSTCGVTV